MKTNDHVTDHAIDHACEVSLIEQLKSVPLDSREWIKNEKDLGLRNIPYGRYCQEAAEALQKAEAEVERLKVINADMRNFLSKAIHNEGFNEEQALKFIYQ